MELGIMLEGQDGLTWARWQRLVRAAEDLGFAGIWRSDHFTNPQGPHKPSLDVWASLTWVASHTERIEFGQLVSPVGFRHPSNMAWTAAAIADLSGGRYRLGLGAGWQDREHRSFGFELLDMNDRFARFEEALAVTRLLLRSDEPSEFNGRFYHLEDALLLPRPAKPGTPPIVIGGKGPKRTLPLVAKYADEWNGVMVPPSRFGELNALLDDLLRAEGRQPAEVFRSLMTRVVIGENEAAVQAKLGDQSAAELRERGVVVGTPDQVIEQLKALSAVGVARLQMQWLDMDDIAGLELVAREVLPNV